MIDLIDRIVEEMLACEAGIYLQSKRPDTLKVKQKKDLENGNADASSGVSGSIWEAKAYISHLEHRRRDLRKEMMEYASRDARLDGPAHIHALHEPREFYLGAIEWLQNHRPDDAKDDNDTYLARFILRHPEIKSWVM